MLIPTRKGAEVVEKEVYIGGGVVLEVPDTRWRVTAEVTAIAVDEQSLHVKGTDFEGWVPVVQVKDVLSPGNYAVDNAINVIGGSGEDTGE